MSVYNRDEWLVCTCVKIVSIAFVFLYMLVYVRAQTLRQ